MKLQNIILAFMLFVYVNAVSDFAKPIKHVLHEIAVPLKITTMVCWSDYDRLKFTANFFHYSFNGRRDYQFAITNTSVHNFPNVQEEHQHLIIVDLTCNDTLTLLKAVGMKLSIRFRWIALITSKFPNPNGVIMRSFKNLPVLPSSEVYCIYKKGLIDFIIKQVYRTSLINDLILEFFGIYRNEKLFDYRTITITSCRRRNLRQTILKATLVVTNNDTLNHLDDYKDKHIDTISKVSYHLTKHLVDYVNGTLKYSMSNSWGYFENDTEKWNGMIGDLVDKRSDIGASALFFTPNRIPFIEYIAMPVATRSKFVFRSPKLSSTDNVFLLPFGSLVWYSLLTLILVTTTALMFASYAEWQMNLTSRDASNPGTLQPSILDVLLIIFGAACQQGSSITPHSLTSRTIMMTIFLSLMFLYTSYSANIVALLQSPSNKIQTLEDLLKSRINLGADDTVFNRYYFSHATEPIPRQIYEQKILNKHGAPNFFALQVGVEKIREGLFAFHMETGVGYKVIEETFLEDEKCGLKEIQYLQVIDPWHAIQKNSSYKELFKAGMMRIYEYGLQDREDSKLYTKKPKCSGGGGKFITASLVDTRPAILVLIWGFLTAVAIFIFEILLNKYSLLLNV